jgi:hypothetical protein
LAIGVSLGASLCGGAEQSLVRETSQKALAKKFEDIFWRLHDAGRLGINDAGL